jgi:prevent-host-death family protein
MLNTTSIPARNLQKSYKAIIEAVKRGKQAMILTTNDQPQAAIVSIEDLEELKKAKALRANLDMLKLATESKEELKNLPVDLRDQASKILYSTHD